MSQPLATLTTMPADKRAKLVDLLVGGARLAESTFGAKTGATKRRFVINLVRDAWPQLDTNSVPDALEDAVIGLLVDLVVAVLNSIGFGRLRTRARLELGAALHGTGA